ncbi:MAG: DUF2092 domain-containing protein [bacterium]
MVRSVLFSILLGFCSPSFASTTDASPPLDPLAVEQIQKMSAYLGSLDSLSFKVHITQDMVLQSGQQIQRGANADIAIARPDKLLVRRNGDIAEQEIYFNGDSFILYGKRVNYFAKMTLSEAVDIDTVLDIAQDEIGVVTPASDLFYQDSFSILMENVTEGFIVGDSRVDGVQCQHLAFRGKDVDWQIWVEQGENPLPKKFLITSKWSASAPQFTAVFSGWNTAATHAAEMFEFTPPDGAEEIEFITNQNFGSGAEGGN